MQRKILAICAALVALGALAIAPSIASAVTLEDTKGGVTTKVAEGSKIVAYSTGTALFVANTGNEVKCTENVLTGTVAKNNGTTIEGTIEDAWFQGGEAETKCDGGSLLGPTRVTIPALTNGASKTNHWCIKNVAEKDEFTLVGANCGTASGTLTFILDGSLTCLYTRSEAVKGTFNTTSHENSVLKVSSEPSFTREEGGSGFLCPSSGVLKGFEFDLYTDTTATSNAYREAANLGAEDQIWIK